MPFRFGEFELEATTRRLHRRGSRLDLEPKVFDFLLYLVEHRDRLVTRDELGEALWPDVVVSDAALARLAKEARKAVGDDGEHQHTIETQRGHGFRFVAEVHQNDEAPATEPPGEPPARSGPDDPTDLAQPTVQLPETWCIRWIFPQPGRIQWRLGTATTVGRGTDCDAVLDGTEVSRHHAELVQSDATREVRDLGSRNGVFVNGQRVAGAVVASGDLVRVGDWIGLVETADRTGRGFRNLGSGLWGGDRLSAVVTTAERAAPSDLPVVIEGAPGSGKRAIGRAIHAQSGRSGALVSVTCASLRDQAGELCGPRGHLARAAAGTLLLVGVPDLAPALQAPLAQALEQGSRVRVVATTERPLLPDGPLRSDLLGQLQGVAIRLPALSERREDVPGLFQHFLRLHSDGHPPPASARLVERLCLHGWPLNLRELDALAQRLLVIHGRDRRLTEADLPALLQSPRT